MLLMASLGIISVNAQTLNVLSCTIQVSENIAESRPRYDLNDIPAAVVIFPETGDRQMEFRGNVIGETIEGKTEVVNTFGNQVVKLEFKKNSK